MNQLKHPLIHPKLENFSFLTSFGALINTNEEAITFLEEVNLIPSKSSTPPQCCDMPMKIEVSQQKKLGWIWRCSSKTSKKKGSLSCRKTFNPLDGTFFDGKSCRIEIKEVLAIILSFVIEMPVINTHRHLQNWRLQRDGEVLSGSTVIDYYSYCREIAEVISSHNDICLGGIGKTVQIDETFLTKRKYHRGRITDQMTVTVLGLYCKEDKTGLFFKVNGKSKQDLWPYIKKYVHHETARLCTDSAKQYHGVETMFAPGTVHLQTNHSKGEYVSCSDSKNTINDLENQNKLLKKSLLCRRTPKLLHQYMALFFYRKQVLKKQYKDDIGSQIMEFLCDIKKVYPGIVDGKLGIGLTLKEIDSPTVESEGLEAAVPIFKKQRLMSIDEEIEATMSEGEDHPDDFF